jgi:hypothetical protein
VLGAVGARSLAPRVGLSVSSIIVVVVFRKVG